MLAIPGGTRKASTGNLFTSVLQGVPILRRISIESNFVTWRHKLKVQDRALADKFCSIVLDDAYCMTLENYSNLFTLLQIWQRTSESDTYNLSDAVDCYERFVAEVNNLPCTLPAGKTRDKFESARRKLLGAAAARWTRTPNHSLAMSLDQIGRAHV